MPKQVRFRVVKNGLASVLQGRRMEALPQEAPCLSTTGRDEPGRKRSGWQVVEAGFGRERVKELWFACDRVKAPMPYSLEAASLGGFEMVPPFSSVNAMWSVIAVALTWALSPQSMRKRPIILAYSSLVKQLEALPVAWFSVKDAW